MAAAFSEGMVDDGYEDVVNIDISSVVIDTMIKKYSHRPQLKCKSLLLISSAALILQFWGGIVSIPSHFDVSASALIAI